MCTEYTNLVKAMKELTQGESPDTVTLPMAENAWNTRPDAESWGVITLDFEADALRGDDVKTVTAWEGSVDLFSRKKDGAGWVAKITGTNKDNSRAREPVQRSAAKIYPNDPCPCGSGKKYKQCHGRL